VSHGAEASDHVLGRSAAALLKGAHVGKAATRNRRQNNRTLMPLPGSLVPMSALGSADERASWNPPRAATVGHDVSRRLRSVAVLAALLVGGCASHDSSPAAPSNDAASAACEQAVPNRQVVGASLTTVQEVRERTGGPGNTSPAAKPWRDLPSDQFAAWCTVQVSGRFDVGSATESAPFVTFLESQTNPGVYPQGPAIP
jgi:hypothetical protein